MNLFIKNFIDNYISEIQNISYYEGDTFKGTTIIKSLSWFDDDELESIFKLAKNNIITYLSENKILWILEKSAFADDVEKGIALFMTNDCINRILNQNDRDKRISEDKKFKGLWTKDMLDTIQSVSLTRNIELKTCLKEMTEKAEQFLGKPIVNQAQ